MKSKVFLFLFVCVFTLFFSSSCNQTQTPVYQLEVNVADLEQALQDNLLKSWYPATIDTVYGGFLSDFTWDWQPSGPQNKMLVSQTRQVWTSSQAAMFLKDTAYTAIARHGLRNLVDTMWDGQYGGFYLLRDRQGEPVPDERMDGYTGEKTAYSNAFAIYALASYYELTHDPEALDYAKRTFQWLEEHSHDPENLGYVNRMTREGDWFGAKGMYKYTGRGIARDYKDQNSSIHILEAFTELYKVWPDPLLRERLQEMLTLIRDTIITDRGYLTLFLELDWTPISFQDSTEAARRANRGFDHVSFGHDVETAFLMLETEHVLGNHNNPVTLAIGKKMVDHALAHGWDVKNGGFYYEGYYFNENPDSCVILNNSKSWWVQAEGLNALLLMSKLFPDESQYYTSFEKQWQYIQTYLIDHQQGGWYGMGLDTRPKSRKAPKASDWKVNYHNYRALMNCIKMLKNESELSE